MEWTDYLDPITSIMLSIFIVYYALPVVVVRKSTCLPCTHTHTLSTTGLTSCCYGCINVAFAAMRRAMYIDRFVRLESLSDRGGWGLPRSVP